MVKFVANTIAVNNSNLTELDNFKPFKPPLLPNIGFESKYKNGKLSVTVTENDILKYKITKIKVAEKNLNKLFKGDNWEPKLFKGDDSIKGSSEGDSLYGYKGDDLIYGNAGDDNIFGGKGKDTLYGGEGGDTMFGGAGKDFLDGGAGINFLTGGGGKDIFSFSAELIGGNYAQINDFTKGVDKIQLSNKAFVGIGPKGPLNASQFFLKDDYDGSANAIIYEDGNLKYAKNAGGTVDQAQTFGRIANGVIPDHTDFVIAA